MAWRPTDDALFAFRMSQSRTINAGQPLGYFDLYGGFHGDNLVMDTRSGYTGDFGTGLKLDHSSVSLEPASSSDFKSTCERSKPPDQ